jgi:hypothetical protein
MINSRQEPVSGQVCNPPDPYLLFFFLAEEFYGTQNQSGSFSLNIVEVNFTACIVISFQECIT